MVSLLVLDLEPLGANLEAVHPAYRDLRLVGVLVAHEPCESEPWWEPSRAKMPSKIIGLAERNALHAHKNDADTLGHPKKSPKKRQERDPEGVPYRTAVQGTAVAHRAQNGDQHSCTLRCYTFVSCSCFIGPHSPFLGHYLINVYTWGPKR